MGRWPRRATSGTSRSNRDALVVLAGAATLRRVINGSGAVVRYLMIGAHNPFDAVEHIDEGRVIVYSAAESALQGERLFFSHDLG